MPARKIHGLMVTLIAAATLGACATSEKTGTLIGAAAGAAAATLIDDDALVIAAGAVLGGYIGNRIGARMDRNDRKKMAQALEFNAPGASSAWTNANTGHRYRLTPGSSFLRDGGSCREFDLVATPEDQAEPIRGTACRQPDGTWVTS